MIAQLLSVACLLGAMADDVPILHRPVPERVTGSDLAKVLRTQTSASWRNVRLRTILNRLANEYKIAILLDRTIDPDQELDLDLGYQQLNAGLQKIANAADADLRILGNTIYLGPPKRVAKLRTLEHLRSQEPLAVENQLPKGRVLDLISRGQTVHWNDLDEPRQIVIDVAQRAGVTIINPEAIPHDLWATGTLPKATLTETLTLLLIQFNLTFAWSADTTQIRLIPIPETVAVEQAHTPAGGPSSRASRAVRERFLQQAFETWKQKFPGLTAKVDVDNNRVILRGTLEQHEAITQGNQLASQTKPPDKNVPPLEKRLFTLRIERVPASALMKKLEDTGVTFQYDPAQLAAQNIDLDKPISMDVKKAKADEFFRALCNPLGLKFTISNVTVTLEPQ